MLSLASLLAVVQNHLISYRLTAIKCRIHTDDVIATSHAVTQMDQTECLAWLVSNKVN